MPLSKVALLCLDSNAFIKYDMLRWRLKNKTKYKPRRNEKFDTMYQRLREDPERFYSNLKMSVGTFDYILENVAEDLDSPVSTTWLSPEEKLFLTLMYLASGATMFALASSVQIGKTTAAGIVFATMKVILKRLSRVHMPNPSPGDMGAYAHKYYEKWKFPNCIGAIGGRFVRILNHKMAIDERVKIYCKKPKVSVVVNAVSDAEFGFLAVRVISKINQNASLDTFADLFQETGMQCPPNSDVKLPLVLIGNEAYPLKNYLMKPYPNRYASTCEGKAKFNETLKQARVTVDCAFEILTKKWNIYSRPFAMNLAHATLVIKSTCLLHNIIKDKDGMQDLHFREFSQCDSGSLLHLVTHKSRKNNRATSIALSIRDQLQEYIKNH